jgi:hypothetical protein
VAELQEADPAAAVRTQLDHRQRAALEREAPADFVLPAGRRVPIAYRAEAPPAGLAGGVFAFVGPDRSLDREVRTLVDRLWRSQFGVETPPHVVPVTPEYAVRMLRDELADGVIGAAAVPLADLFPEAALRPLKLSRDDLLTLRFQRPWLARIDLDAGELRAGGDGIATVGIPYLLLVSEGLDGDAAYAVTQALWRPSTLRQIAAAAPDSS